MPRFFSNPFRRRKNSKELRQPSDTLTVEVPDGWHNCTDEQLLYIYRLISADIYTWDEIKTNVLCRFSQITVRKRGGKVRIFDRRRLTTLSPVDLTVALPLLDWIEEAPRVPVCPAAWDGRKSISKTLQGEAFSTYLFCENLYQAHLLTKSPQPLERLFTTLYPADDGKRSRKPLPPEALTAALLWYTGLKRFFARKWPHLFSSSSGGSSSGSSCQPTAEDIMNASIRALTGGDITREEQILNADAWRALTELNEKAREVHEIKKRRK